MPFVQTGTSLNKYWSEMLDAMTSADTRPVYLLTFESALSGCMDVSIYDFDRYKKTRKLTPMPEDPGRIMPLQAYRSWVTTYTEIMREEHLLGLIKDKKEEVDGDIGSFLEDDV